jgi:hypothetical protein
MGYKMDQDDTEFFISKDKFNKVIDAIHNLKLKNKSFQWVSDSFYKIKNIKEIFDSSGSINNITFIGEKLGDDDVLFDAIAPYVRAGSYITMRGEDGAIWRWSFKGLSCIEEYGKIIFE